MQEVKPTIQTTTRTLDEVTKEFNNWAWNAGQMQYQIAMLTHDLAELNQKMKALNQEAASLKALATAHTDTKVGA